MSYLIKRPSGYTERIGEIVAMLTIVRETTLSEIKDLTAAELNHRFHPSDNSIASLLSHIAAIEAVHQIILFEEREPNEDELSNLNPAIRLDRTLQPATSITEYLTRLEAVRTKTLNILKHYDDAWLYQEKPSWNHTPYNNYYLWFHVIEDEISHRGQIKMIKRRLRTKQSSL